jgi:hypothetical protein
MASVSPLILRPSLPPSVTSFLPPSLSLSRSPSLTHTLSQAAKGAGRDDDTKETYPDTNGTYLDAKETYVGEGLKVDACSTRDDGASVGDDVRRRIHSVDDDVRRRIHACHMTSVGDDVSASSVVDKVEALAWLYVSC